MTPPTAIHRPANAAYRRHALTECKTGNPKRCDVCRQLEADASAEDWRRWGGAE